MKYIQTLSEKGKLEWQDSDAPDANGRFKDLSPKDLAAWLIKTRKGDMKKISGSLSQQVAFNKNDDPEYAKKMDKTRKEVYKQLDREDLLESVDMDDLDNAKEQLSNPHTILDITYDKTRRGDKFVRFDYENKYVPGKMLDSGPHFVNVRYDSNKDLKKISKELGMDLKESVLNEEDTWNDYPAAAKKNAQKAIDWKEKYGRDEVDAGTPVGWARAHQLAKGENLSTDTVKRMSAFNRHRKNSSIKPELKETPWKDRGYVAWLIWGGDEGVDWAIEKSKEIDAMKESNQLKYIKPLNEAEKYITDEFKVGDKIKTNFGEWEVIETDYAPNKSFIAPFIFKGKDMKRVNIPNPPKTNKNAVGYKVTDGDKYPIIGFLYQYKDITKLATVGVDESVTEKLTRGLKPLLTIGSTITKKDGEDALLDLSDKFDSIDDEYAGTIASHLDMAIELMQDGYPGDATKKLKQFNKACKDVLKGKEVGSAFESVTEASRRKVHKAAKQGSYPAVIVVVQDGKVIHQEPVSTPDVAPATFNVMQEKYPKAVLHLEDNTGKRLFTESVNEAKAYKLKASEFGADTHSAAYNVKGEPTWRVHSTYAIDQVSGENNPEERDVVFFEAMPINNDIYIKIGGINNLKRSNGATVGNNFSTTIDEWKIDSNGIAKEASDFLTDATHLKWINKKARSEGQAIKWALKDDYSSVIEDLVNKSLGLTESVVNEDFPGKGETVKAKDLNHEMLDYFNRMNISLSINTKSKKNIKGSVGTMFNDLVFNGGDIDKKDIVSVKIIESVVTEAKIKYAKGKTYQSSGHWTVYVDSNSSGFDIRVNHSAGWRLDPHDEKEETLELLDNGRQKATIYFKSGNIDKFAQKMFDLNDRTTNGNQTKLTAKDYADIIRVWIDMKMANESIVNEWGSSDQAVFNKSMHKEMGSPRKMPSPFDDKLRDVAADNVDHYWDDWEEYDTDRDGLIDNAVRGYLRSFFKKDFEMMQRMFASNNLTEGIYAKQSKIVPGEYIKTQYGYFYKRVEGKVGGQDAYVEIKKGKEGKRKTSIHDTVDFEIVDKEVAFESVVTEGMSKSAIKKAIKVIDQQIEDEEGGDGEPLDNETLQALEQERERLQAMNESKFSPIGYAKRVISGEITLKDAMKEAGVSFNNLSKLILKLDKGFDIDAAVAENTRFKHLKSLNEYYGKREHDDFEKEFGKIKYPKWIKVKMKELVDGMFINKLYAKPHNYMSLWLNQMGKRKFNTDDRKKELGEVGYKLTDRYWHDLTGHNAFKLEAAEAAMEVSKHIEDMVANKESVEPAYYLMKNYFNTFEMQTDRSRIFNMAVEILEEWMTANAIETL